MNITLLGLSGSGKTCYLYTAAHILARGISENAHTISATSCNREITTILHRGIEDMVRGKWPEGSNKTLAYPFALKIDGKPILQFTIYDYRGNALDHFGEDDKKQTKELFETFEESSCIVFLIDGNTLRDALDSECLRPEHRRKVLPSEQLSAINKICYIESLLKDCNEQMERNVPILLVITKRDIFFEEELHASKKLLKELLPTIFSSKNDMIVGITAVTLGEIKEDGQLKELWLNTDGNIHLPILFALFQDIENLGQNSDIDEAKSLIVRLFPSNRIDLYRGGKEAFIV